MGLFNIFSKKNGHPNGQEALSSVSSVNNTDIPESVFIEKEKQPSENRSNSVFNRPEFGINFLWDFLDRNFEQKGYDDALINPDGTHLQQNITAIRNDMERTVRKVKTFYEDFIRDIDFHIGSRGRSGMIDTVEELTAKKITAEEHIKQVIEIEEQAKKNEGVGMGVIISYTQGFKNGLAAISHHSILRRNF
jgi:hypothetical protein